MVSDLLALLDALDGLHKAATNHLLDPKEAGGWSAAGKVIEAYPRLSAALREALDVGAHPHIVTCNAARTTPIGGDMCSCPAGLEIKRLRAALAPTTDGEREARSIATGRNHLDLVTLPLDARLSALRHVLALLDAERAKAADAARERAAIVADLRSRLDNLWALMQDHTASPETIAYYQGARETRAFLADRYESGAHTKVTP